MKSVTEVLFQWIQNRQDNRGFFIRTPWWEGLILRTVCRYPVKVEKLERQLRNYKREANRLELKLQSVLAAAALTAPEETGELTRRKR